MAIRYENGKGYSYSFSDDEIKRVRVLPAYKTVPTETAGVLDWVIIIPEESNRNFFEDALILAGIQLQNA